MPETSSDPVENNSSVHHKEVQLKQGNYNGYYYMWLSVHIQMLCHMIKA